MNNIVDFRFEKFLNTTHNNTLNSAIPSEFVTYIGNLKKYKSPALDCISTNTLIHLPLNCIFLLTFLINAVLNLRMFPDCWKKALIVPIPIDHSSFRPISRLSCLSKVYEYNLTSHLKEFITAHSIVISEHFGFRPKISTQCQIWRYTELIYEGFLRRWKTGVVFIYIV